MDDEQWRIADYAKADLNQKLIIGFLRIGRTMRKQYEGRGSQKRVLILIQDAGGSIAQKELTRRLGIQPGSVSEILGKLEKSGLLRRKAHAADRRAIDLILTEEGKEAAKEASDRPHSRKRNPERRRRRPCGRKSCPYVDADVRKRLLHVPAES